VVALAEIPRARLLLGLGDHAGAARAAASALSSARQRGLATVVLAALLVQADVDMARRQLGQAERTLLEAARLADGDTPSLARIHLLMGRLHAQRGEDAEAERYLLAAISALEQQRAEMGISEYALSRLPARESAYREYAALLLRQGRYHEGFQWLDAERARYLRDVRRAARLSASGTAGADLQRLHEQLRAAKDSVRAAGESASLALVTRVSRLRAQIAHALGYPEAERLLEIDALQRRLRAEGRSLLAYFLDEPAHAFVLTGTGFHAIPLAFSRAEIMDVWEALTPPPRAEDLGGAGAFPFHPEPLHRLYRMLFEPIERYVPAGAPVTVIMDRDVGQVPFAMLLREPARPYRFDEWPYLLYRNAFSVEIAAALLLEEATGARQPLPLLAAGRSRFDGDLVPVPFRGAGLTPLPHVASEVRYIGRRFSGATVLLDDRARESRLYQLLPDADVLHLATHAFLADEAPLYSAILLTSDPKTAGPDGDGVLYLYELAGRHLNASLVVLSGCSTARGQARRGEGVIGLHYGFRAAGARASLATLWPVEDAATSRVMKHFYRHLRRGLSKDEALRLAQIDYLRSADREGANPFFWAAPVLAGDPSPIDVQRSPLAPGTWAGIAAVLLLGAILTRRLRLFPPPDGRA
jgi:CHAT domain-containing protein